MRNFHGEQLQAPIPTTKGFSGLPLPLGKWENADPFSVAREILFQCVKLERKCSYLDYSHQMGGGTNAFLNVQGQIDEFTYYDMKNLGIFSLIGNGQDSPL